MVIGRCVAGGVRRHRGVPDVIVRCLDVIVGSPGPCYRVRAVSDVIVAVPLALTWGLGLGT